MPDSKQHDIPSDDSQSAEYKILRKGSVYNIVGPHGREFNKYKSASVVGPLWEELTHTPWPHESSAFTPGMRLWELGIIQREHVGLRKLLADLVPGISTAQDAKQPTSKPDQQTQRPAKKATPNEAKPAQPVQPKDSPRAPSKPSQPRQQRLMFQENWDNYREPIKPDRPAKESSDESEDDLSGKTGPLTITLALPAPRINPDEQARQINALRRNSQLLLDGNMRDVLQNEVDYHRPYANWARALLNLLDRFARRQRRRKPHDENHSQTIMDKHLAWQKERQERVDTAASSN